MQPVPERIEFRRYALPFRATVRTAHGPWAVREGVWVRIEGADGRVGYGEAAPVPGFSRETVDAVEEACAALGGRFDRGTGDPGTIGLIPAGLPTLRNALAAASDRSGVAPFHATLPVAALLPAGRAALERARELADLDFRIFKWKVGVGEAADEMGLMDDLCAALPGGAKLRLDANGGWNRRTAERWLDRCSERPVDFVEQPVDGGARGAEDLLLGLANDYPVALALDESVAGEADIQRWLGLGWRGVFVIKLSLLGDVGGGLARLRAAGADVVFSSALETALGARAALRHAFTWQGGTRALGFGVWPLFADARYDGPQATPFLRWDDVERIRADEVWGEGGDGTH